MENSLCREECATSLRAAACQVFMSVFGIGEELFRRQSSGGCYYDDG